MGSGECGAAVRIAVRTLVGRPFMVAVALEAWTSHSVSALAGRSGIKMLACQVEGFLRKSQQVLKMHGMHLFMILRCSRFEPREGYGSCRVSQLKYNGVQKTSYCGGRQSDT